MGSLLVVCGFVDYAVGVAVQAQYSRKESRMSEKSDEILEIKTSQGLRRVKREALPILVVKWKAQRDYLDELLKAAGKLVKPAKKAKTKAKSKARK